MNARRVLLLAGAGLALALALIARRASAALAAPGDTSWVPVAMSSDNVVAFLALIRQVEANGAYDLIAGGDRFTDFSEHPFVLNPARRRPIGTTASGAYQMVRKTWQLARDGLGLTDFSRASQDAAAVWLLRFKVPGRDSVNLSGTGNYELVESGRFDEAIEQLRPEWEAFERMTQGRYHVSLEQARDLIEAEGGQYA